MMQIAKLWRRQGSNLRLEGSRCKTCGHLAFPEEIQCSECTGKELEKYPFKGNGKIIAHTTVYEAPLNFAAQVPYTAALVRLDEGVTVAAMITDINVDDVQNNQKVTMVTRRIEVQGNQGPIVYAYKFAPEL